MSKTMKNIPKVRFPEFRDAPEWEEKKLIDLCEKISDGIHSTPIYDDNGEFYFINGNNLTNSKIEITENTKKINETEYLKYKVELSSQTILISINGTIGNLAFFNNEKIILGKSASYINLKLNENKYFIFNLLQSSNTKKHFEKELTGSTIKNLSLTTIKNTKVFFPHPKEQQKIAECLSSLDALILAQSSKVEALKAHKKALMQQLFPAEGKTTPRLRFPEFQNDGEWEKNDFSNYIKLYRGSSPRPIQEYLTKDASGVNWIKIGDTKNAVNSIINKVEEKITQEGAEKSRKVNVGELILANSMSFGKTYELEIEGCIYDGWFVLREYEEYFYNPNC